jgi:chromosome segregation ATPase
MAYETRRRANDGGGDDLAAATGLLGKDSRQKVAKKKKRQDKKRKSPRKKEYDSPSKSALEQALSGFDTPSDHGGKKTPDLMAKEAIAAAEEFMRCNSVPEGLVTAKDGLAGALPALATRHAEMRAPLPNQTGVQWEHSADAPGGKETPGGFGSYDSFGLDLPQTPPELLPDPEYRQELMRAADKSATKKMRKAKQSYDAKTAKANGPDFSRRSLSPLRTDPKLAARQIAESAKAAATAHPWRGSTPELDGWTKNPYVPHAEEARYKERVEKVKEVGTTSIPAEFQSTVDDPIFPSLEAELMDVAINDDGTFKKTTFPTKRPNRRSQIAALAESLDKMLESLEAEDAKKLAEMDAANEKERHDRLVAEAEVEELSPEEVERRAKADVEKESASVALMIDRLEREDQVVQTVLGEMQRQIALQSKDRAKLLERVGSHYHELVERAVNVSKMGDSLKDEQLEKMALLAAQMDALRKKFQSQVLTTENREARISELMGIQRDLEAELEKARSKALKAERGREKALKEAAGGRALMQENADFKHLNEELELRVKELSNLVEETNLDVKRFKKQWEMEKSITADLTEQLEKERNAPRAKGASFGKRPVRAVRKVASTPAMDAEKEKLKEILEQERALRAKRDAADEDEKLAMKEQMDKLEAERLAAEQRLEDVSQQATAAQPQQQDVEEYEEEEEDEDDQPVREMTKEEEQLDDEMMALQNAMAQKAKRVKGLMSEDLDGAEPDDAHGAGLAAILGDHVDSDDEGEISGDEDHAGEKHARQESGAAKLAQMQLAKMQREMAATEAKLAMAHANRERLEKEQRALKDKLESGRLSAQDAAVAMEKMAKVMEAKSQAEEKETKIQGEMEETERLQAAIAVAEGDDVEAAVAQAVQASVQQKQSTVAEADDSIREFIVQEAEIREELAQLEADSESENEAHLLREKLMDLELKRTELVTVRENTAADLVLEQVEAAELGIADPDSAGPVGVPPEEPMDVYAVRQFERTVGRLRERVDAHRANVNRDKSRQTLLNKRVREMKAQIGGNDTPWDEAVAIRGQLIDAEVELGSIGFHQDHETAEMKGGSSWIVRLEDGKRAADGVAKVLSELVAYFQERKKQIHLALAAIGTESQRNTAEAAKARNDLAKATAEERPDCERKLGALEGQRVKLVEMNLALNDEMVFCDAELLEMQSKHGATVALDARERAVKMAEETEAALQMQIQEQSLQLQEAEQRKKEIETAAIKLQTALKRGELSDNDTKDAELQLRDLEAEKKVLDAKNAQVAAQQQELVKATVEFEAAAKEAKAHGTSMAVRKLVEQQLARSEKAVLDTQTELDKAEVETQRLEKLEQASTLGTVEMESIIRQKKLLEQRVADLSHSLGSLEDETRMTKAQVVDMHAAEIEAAETADSGGGGESHRVAQVRAELEARNQQADAYEAKVQEILMREQLLTDQKHDEGDAGGAIAAELEIIAMERERAIELRHSCAEEIKELNSLTLEHSEMQSTQKEIEDLSAAITTANKQVTGLHKEEMHLRQKVESGILTGSDLQQATDRIAAVREEAHELEKSRHQDSLKIQTAQELLQTTEEKATKRHEEKVQRAEEEIGATQLQLRVLQKEEAQLMHELESSTSKEDVQAKLGKLAIEREMLQTKLTAEQSVKEHVAEKHDVVIKEKIVHVHHYKNTQHVVATEGYDQSAKLQRPGAAAGSAPIPMVGNTDGFVGATTTRSTFEGVQTDIDPKMQAGITAANRAQHAAEASAAQQTAITSSLTSASHEAQEAARRAQEEAQALRSNVGTMDLEIADLRQQLAAQQQAQESGKPLFTAADVFAESTQIIVAAKASVDDVRTIIADTPALKSHENMKEPCVQLEAAFAKLSEQSKRMAAVASSPATKLAAAEIQRQEVVVKIAQKEAAVSGSNTARSNLSHASSAVTARSSEQSALSKMSKEASTTLDKDKAKLQEILEEERVLAAAKAAANSAAASVEEKERVEQQLAELARKKDEAAQRVERQQAVTAQAATQHAEMLLSEPVQNASPDLTREKARLTEILASERAMRDKLNSFSISDAEKETMMKELEQVEVQKSEAVGTLGRTVSTSQAEALLTEAVATSSPVLDREKERLQAILTEERTVHAALEAASAAERQRIHVQLEQLQAEKVETSQRLGQQLYEIQAEQVLAPSSGSIVAAVTRLPSVEQERNKLSQIIAEERVLLAAKAEVEGQGSVREKEKLQEQLERLAADKATATQRVERVEQVVADHNSAQLAPNVGGMIGQKIVNTSDGGMPLTQQAPSQGPGSVLSTTTSSTKHFAAELEQQIAGEDSLRNDLQQADHLIQQLGSQNRALEDQVSTLGSSLFKSNQKKDQLQQQLTETLKAVRNMKERKAEEAQIGPSQADVDAANKKMLRYRELLKVSEQDVLLAQERLMRSLKENQNMQAEVYDAREELTAMQQEVTEMRMEVDRYKKERDDLSAQVARLEELLAAAQLEAARAKELELERDQLLARIKELERQIEEKDNLINKLQQDAAELGRKLAQALLDLEESERLRAEAEAKVAEMEAAEAARTPDSELAAADTLELMLALAMNTAELNKQRKAQVAAVKTDLKQAEKERDDALAALEEAKKALAALQAEMQASKFADGQKDARIAELEARIAELEKALAAALADVDLLYKKLAAAEEAAAQAAKDAADAAANAATANANAAAAAKPKTPPPDNSAEFAAAKSENEALKKRIKELLEEIDKLTAALKMTNEALAAAEQKQALVPVDNDDALRALRASMAELMAALAEAQAEAARLRRLNEQLEAALAAAGLQQPAKEGETQIVRETDVVVETTVVVDEAEIERLKQEIEDLKKQLQDALEREALLQEQLAGAKALIEKLQASQDDADLERVQWEKEKRDEFQGTMTMTSEKGSQTDSEEHKLQLAAEKSSREVSRVMHDERARHKPRFLVPEKADESHQNRDAKPLRWLLRLIRSLYDDKYLADAVDNRHNHPHDPLPEFIFVWTAKRYGLRGLVAQTRWDIANAANAYDDVPEVRTFLSFVQEAYDTEQLSFYLYARAVVHDRSCSNANEKLLQDSSKRETGHLAEMRYIPLSLVQELVSATFSERLSPNNREAILAYAEKEAVMWTPPESEQAPSMQGLLGRSGGFDTTGSFAATQTLTSGMNATLNATTGKGTFQSAFGVSREYGGNEELPIVLDEARLLELLMQAYTADRASYDVRLGQIFAETDIDGDGEIDKDDFVRFVASAVPQWSAGHAKDVFWKVTGALGKEVLDMDGVLMIAREYELFNGALQIPKFTSEDEVLSAGELELVWNAIANHRSYLDQGFVRKMTARWQKVYKMGGSTNAGGTPKISPPRGGGTSPARGRSPDRGAVPQRYVLETDGAIPQNALRKQKRTKPKTTSTASGGADVVGGGGVAQGQVEAREYVGMSPHQSLLEGDIGQWEDESVEPYDSSLPVLGPSEVNATGTFEPVVAQEGVNARQAPAIGA